MSKASLLRALWIPDLNTVTGQLTSGLASWIEEGSGYSISTPVMSTTFSLDILAPIPLNMAFAYDLGRMASASFETILSVSQVASLPRSMAWFVIKTYYSAFFAAHAIARMFGTSCSQLNAVQFRAVRQKAASLAITPTQAPSSGNYTCVYNHSKQKLDCTLNASAGGIHIAFWQAFGKVVDDLSNRVILLTSETASNKEPVYSKLLEIRDIVSNGWLSDVRNEVNYKQLLGCWYPYKGLQKKEREAIQRRLRWSVDPLNVPLNRDPGDLERFVNTCSFLISLCKVLTTELAERCPGKSFLEYQSAPILRLASAAVEL